VWKDSFPTYYLGLFLGAKFKVNPFESQLWEDLRKDSLGGELIAFLRGRLTLIQSVLSSISTYFLSLFLISVLVAPTMGAIQKKFIWGSFGGAFKYHLVR